VKSYLIEHGVGSTQVTTVGRGEEADHLPANGRAVTFLACTGTGQAAPQVAEETPPAPPAEPAPPPPPQSTTVEVQPVVPVAVPVATPPPAPLYLRGFGFAMMAGGMYQD